MLAGVGSSMLAAVGSSMLAGSPFRAARPRSGATLLGALPNGCVGCNVCAIRAGPGRAPWLPGSLEWPARPGGG